MKCEFPECKEPASFHYREGSITRHLCILHMRKTIPFTEQNERENAIELLNAISTAAFHGTVVGIQGLRLEDSIWDHKCCLLVEKFSTCPTILINEADLDPRTISKIEFMLNGDFRILPIQCNSLFDLMPNNGQSPDF